jgi:hypothetical protein
MVQALLIVSSLLAAGATERVAVVTVGKEGVSVRTTGNVWYALERKLSRIDGVRILDAGEQTLKLRADSGTAVDGCRFDVTCLAAIGTRLAVDRLFAAQVAPVARGGFLVKIFIVDVAARKIAREISADVRASGDVDGKIDGELRKVFAVAPGAASTAILPRASVAPPAAPPAATLPSRAVTLKTPLTEAPASAPKVIAKPAAPIASPIEQSLTVRQESGYRPAVLGGTGIAIAVFSLATLAAAIGVGASGQSLQGTIDDRTGQLTAERTARDANARSTIANVGYALGGAGFCVGATLFAVDIWRFKNR